MVPPARLGLSPRLLEAGEFQGARVPPAPAHRHEYRLPVAAEVDQVRAIRKCEDLEAPEPAAPRGADAVVIFRLHRCLGCGSVGRSATGALWHQATFPHTRSCRGPFPG